MTTADIIREAADLLVAFAQEARNCNAQPTQAAASAVSTFLQSLRRDPTTARLNFDAAYRLEWRMQAAGLQVRGEELRRELQQRALPTAEGTHPKLVTLLREALEEVSQILGLLPTTYDDRELCDLEKVHAVAQRCTDLASSIYAEVALLEAGRESLAQAEDLQPPSAPNPVPSENKFHWSESGCWVLVFAGISAEMPKDLLGMRYICALLEWARRPIPCVELESLAVGSFSSQGEHLTAYSKEQLDADGIGTEAGSRQELADSQAFEGIERAVRELAAEREQAEANHDSGAIARINARSEELESAAKRLKGLGGRPRSFSHDGEKARKRVFSNIRRAETAIGRVHEALANHLRRSIKTAGDCVYEPGKPIDWLV